MIIIWAEIWVENRPINPFAGWTDSWVASVAVIANACQNLTCLYILEIRSTMFLQMILVVVMCMTWLVKLTYDPKCFFPVKIPLLCLLALSVVGWTYEKESRKNSSADVDVDNSDEKPTLADIPSVEMNQQGTPRMKPKKRVTFNFDSLEDPFSPDFVNDPSADTARVSGFLTI